MRAACKAQVVDGGGLLHDGRTYVLKDHLTAVVDAWSNNYQDESCTRSKLCDKVS